MPMPLIVLLLGLSIATGPVWARWFFHQPTTSYSNQKELCNENHTITVWYGWRVPIHAREGGRV